MPRLKTLILSIVVAAGVVVTLAGCGTNVVDQAATASAVQEKVEAGLHVDFETAVCPENQSIKTGSTFACTLTGKDGSTVRVDVRILDMDADLEIISVRGGGPGAQ